MTEVDPTAGPRRSMPAYLPQSTEMPYQQERASMRQSRGEARFGSPQGGADPQHTANAAQSGVLNMHQFIQSRRSSYSPQLRMAGNLWNSRRVGRVAGSPNPPVEESTNSMEPQTPQP